jgi:hypothetical protein
MKVSKAEKQVFYKIMDALRSLDDGDQLVLRNDVTKPRMEIYCQHYEMVHVDGPAGDCDAEEIAPVH